MSKISKTFTQRESKEIIFPSQTSGGQMQFFTFTPAEQLHWNGKPLDTQEGLNESFSRYSHLCSGSQELFTLGTEEIW